MALTFKKKTERNPWSWIPSLYFAEGIPYVIIIILSGTMYKRLGVSNTDIALYTSWLYLPWLIKPLWSPIVDIFKTKRYWIVIMQLIIGVGFGGVAFTVPASDFFQWTLCFFWLLAFSSATHDIAADGFYMLGLSESDQSFFVGIRSTFYRFAMMTGQGLLIILAGYFEVSTGLPKAEFVIRAETTAQTALVFNPNEIQTITSNDELKIITSTIANSFSTENIDKNKAKNLVEKVKAWNESNSFYTSEDKIINRIKNESSWYTENISKPLGNWLKNNFGEEVLVEKSKENVGNIALMYCYLSKKPEEEVVVNIAHRNGDKSIDIYKEKGKYLFDRFVFTEENWNKPAISLVQFDPKLKKETTATFELTSGNIPLAWSLTFIILSAMFLLLFVYHRFILPYPTTDISSAKEKEQNVFTEFLRTFKSFFKKKEILIAILFLMTYRLGESQLVKMAALFLLDTRDVGGLALTTGEVGLVYGTIGIIGLTLGGILGGIVASRKGLKFWIWWMFLCINLPNAAYIYLAYAKPDSYFLISTAIAVEQFGYGFGFTAYMLYMIYISQGEHKTAHFALTTGFMALGMMIPGMWSGWLQEAIGYKHFFVWVLLCIIPSGLVMMFIKVDPGFGKKTLEE